MDNQSMDNIDKLAKRLSSINKDFRKLAPHRILIIATLVLLLITAIFLIQRQQDIRGILASNEFIETFDGNPSTPQPFTQIGQNRFDVQIHTRGELYTLEEMDALHGMDCGAPPATHHLTGNYEDSVFTCKNHIMTALNSGSYGVIYLTPNSMIDFSNGEAVLTFEMSTEKMSGRDWWDLTISPFNDAQALPLLSDLSQGVDLQKPNKNSVVISTDNGEGSPNLKVVRDGQVTAYPNHFFNFTEGITPGTNQMATRQTFKLTISKNRVKFERLSSPTATALPIIDETIPNLSWSQGVIQFGHHSYNPFKDNSGVAATWHWDSFFIQPAIPFTMIKANRRYADENNPNIVFNSPAPSNSYLRFSGYCSIKANGVQAKKMTDDNHPEHMSSYMMPIAEGEKNFNFTFSADGWFNQDCIAKDFAIWSREVPVGGENPTSVPNPTATTTPNTPTATSAPQATATTTPTATQAPSATPTPVVNSISALSLSPVNSTNTVGNNFTVQVRVNTNGQTVNGVDAKLNFPTNLLSVISINDDGSAFDIEAESGVSNNTINLAYASSTPKSGNLLVATITFRANTAGTANVTFTSDSEVISNISNSNVLKTKTNGSYTLVNPTPTPTRIPTPTNTPVPTKAPLLTGDVNADGKVDVQDLSYILSKWRTSDAKADLNKNGRVDISDISILLENWTR